jgi:hypothetical protein
MSLPERRKKKEVKEKERQVAKIRKKDKNYENTYL